jgi:hypothetical protein
MVYALLNPRKVRSGLTACPVQCDRPMKLSLCFLGSEVAHFEAKRAPARHLPALDLDDDAPTLLMAKSSLAQKATAERRRPSAGFAQPNLAQSNLAQSNLAQSLTTPMMRAVGADGTRSQSRRATGSK